MLTQTFSILRSSRFQLTALLLSFIYITSIHVWQYESDFYSEQTQRVLPTSKSIEELASNVTVGLHINNFPRFSFNKNEFIMHAIVWFRFPIGTQDIATIESFEFQNGEITQKSKPIIKLIQDDAVICYQVRVEFKTYLDYHYFPVGDHRLAIILHNKSVTPHEMTFRTEPDNFELSDNILVTNWIPVKKGVQAGYIRSALNKTNDDLQISYPVAIYTIDFQNHSARDLITLYFPLFVMFFIGFFTLMIGLTDSMRLSMIASSMPILVLYRFVIDAISPQVSTMTKVDVVYLLLVFLSLILLMFQAYVTLSVRNKKERRAAVLKRHLAFLDRFNSVMFIGVLLVLLIVITINGVT